MRILLLLIIVGVTISLAYLIVKDISVREEEAKLVQKPRPDITEESLALALHKEINRQRKLKGLGELEWNPVLARIAKKHSEDMAIRKYFAHVTPEGYDLTYRYAQDNFLCYVRIGDTIYAGAENIYISNLAYSTLITVNQSRYYNWNTEDAIAATTVSDWMGSEYHRENIMQDYWTREGLGVYFTKDYRIYITQNFC